jgi:hypothetical protein
VTAQDLARDVNARLGRDIFVAVTQADVSVEGHIEARRGGGWRAVIVLRDAHGATLGTRELERTDASCATLREPLALVIAVMLDPDASLRPPPADSAPPPPTAPSPTPPSPPPPIVIEKEVPVLVPAPGPPVTVASPPAPTWRLDAGASFTAGFGLLPSPAIGGYAGGLIEPPGLFPLEAFGIAWLDAAVSQSGASGTFSLDMVGAGLCPLHVENGYFRAYGCADGEIGLLTGRVTGQPIDQELLVAGALEGRASVHVAGPFALRIGASLVFPVTRHDFAGGGTGGSVFQIPVVASTVDVGTGVLFP